MRQTIIYFISILFVSVLLLYIFIFVAPLDEQFIISFLIIISLQLSLILAIVLKRR